VPVRGSAGGRATLEKHGVEHFRELGRRGFQSFTDRYFSGDREAAMEWLRTRAYVKQADTFAERELQRRIQNGEKMASVELPVYSYGDDEPPF
jgi:hypothetical protein